MIEIHRYRGRRPPQPHLVASTYSGIRTAGPVQGLTLHEIRAEHTIIFTIVQLRGRRDGADRTISSLQHKPTCGTGGH